MKLFQALSDEHKERSIHMAEHIVLESFLENGFEGNPETDEEKAHFAEIREVLETARGIEDHGEQLEFLFENSATGDLIFEKAYELASSAFYIESGEVAFNLDEMDSHFGDDSDEDDAEEIKKDVEVPPVVKKDNKHLN